MCALVLSFAVAALAALAATLAALAARAARAAPVTATALPECQWAFHLG